MELFKTYEVGTFNGRLFIKENITIETENGQMNFTKTFHGTEAVEYLKETRKEMDDLIEACAEAMENDLMK